MGYIILHNRQDAASRDFVAGLPEGGGHQIIEWYTDAAAVSEFLSTYPSVYPSAFPSVLIHRADKDVPEAADPVSGEIVPAHTIPAHWELVRCPADLAEVAAIEADW